MQKYKLSSYYRGMFGLAIEPQKSTGLSSSSFVVASSRSLASRLWKAPLERQSLHRDISHLKQSTMNIPIFTLSIQWDCVLDWSRYVL